MSMVNSLESSLSYLFHSSKHPGRLMLLVQKWQGGGHRLLKGVGLVHALKAGEGALSEISKTWHGFTEERRWGRGRGGRLLERVRFS